MALSSTSRPSLRGRVLARLPATLNAAGGLAVTKTDGVWTFEPDWSDLELIETLPDPESKELWVKDPVTEVFYRLSVQALIDELPDGPTGPTGATGATGAAGASGDTIGKHTIHVPASAMLSAITSGPARAQFETTTNDLNFVVLDFDASADEHAHFNIQMPKSWNEGTITFQVEWMSTATDTDGVAWGLQAVAVADNGALDATWGTPVVVTDDAQSAATELYVTAESGAVTVGGTPAAGKKTFFRIFRDVSDANDDMTEDARLIGVTIFYTINAATDA